MPSPDVPNEYPIELTAPDIGSYKVGNTGIDYITQWGSKFGGLPFHMYVHAGHVPDSDELVSAADRELRYIADQIQTAPPSSQRDQLALFAMMSYAEKLRPGSLFRTSGK